MNLTPKQKDKRRGIALATIPLFLAEGIKNSSISSIAKHADIGKGTIYQYFENKEDIVFEIFDFFSEFMVDRYQELLQSNFTAKEKITKLLTTVVKQESEVKDVHPIFVEYYSISMTTDNQKIKEYNRKFFDKFISILTELIQEGINNKEFKNQKALDVVTIFAAATDGILFYNEVIGGFKNEKNLENLLLVIFTFLECNPQDNLKAHSPYFF